ncbi:MAG: oligosaccharide flippase family protein [Spirochaetota bacterium]|nr:oligosaccharide flippase family protein [Spirochaetota bacterium]
MEDKPQTTKEIKRKAKKGFLQYGSAKIFSKILNSVSFVIAAAYMNTAEIGVASLVKSIILLILALIESGFPDALVQSISLTKKQSSSSFWFLTFWALFLFFIIAVVSPLIEQFFKMDGLAVFILGASLQLIFISIALVPGRHLERKLDFGYIGIIDTIGIIGSSITKITLAVLGAGAWALILGPVTNSFIKCIMTFWITRYLPSLYFSWTSIKGLLNFGYKRVVSNFIYRFYKNADYLIIGMFLGETFLGVYRVAFELSVAPALTVSHFFNKVSFSAFSRLQNSRDKLKSYFLDINRSLAMIVGPISVFLFVTAEDLLRMCFGERYIDATIAIKLLCIMGFIRSLSQLIPKVINAIGRADITLWNSIITLIILTSAIFTAVVGWKDTMGMIPICLAWLISYPILWLIVLIIAKMQIDLSFKSYFWNLTPSLLGLILMGLSMEGMKYIGRTTIPAVNVVLPTVVGLGFYLFYITKIMKVDLMKIFPKKM